MNNLESEQIIQQNKDPNVEVTNQNNQSSSKKKIFFSLNKNEKIENTSPNLKEVQNRPRLKLRKNMFVVKKEKTFLNNEDAVTMIFEVKKVPKSLKKESKIKLSNFTEKYERVVGIDELKNNLQFKIRNRKIIDPSEIKQIFKVQLLNKFGVYMTPESSDQESDKEEEMEGVKMDEIEEGIRPIVPKKEKKIEMKYIFKSTEKSFNCSCRKSQCNKNYCACRNNNETCNRSCTCEDCQNPSNIK